MNLPHFKNVLFNPLLSLCLGAACIIKYNGKDYYINDNVLERIQYVPVRVVEPSL